MTQVLIILLCSLSALVGLLLGLHWQSVRWADNAKTVRRLYHAGKLWKVIQLDSEESWQNALDWHNGQGYEFSHDPRTEV